LQYLIVWAVYLNTKEPAYTAAMVITIPQLGRLLPKDSYPVFNSSQHNKNIWQVFPLVVHVLFTWTTIAYLFVTYPFKDFTWIQCWQLYVTLLFIVPASIDAAHELIHRPQMGFKAVGFVNMALFQFSVYPYEHLYLHHKFVGTDKDPITSPKNQNFYVYTIRAFVHAHKFVFSKNKKMFALCMGTNWLYLGVMFVHALSEHGNWQQALWKVGVFVGIGLGAFAFLEVIEYIEHYGLVYRSDKDEEGVAEVCSWNADENMLNNWLIFRFQRHSDHHMNAYKIFTTLELTEKMPKFPFNFLEGAFIAIIPPLWYHIMNPYVDEVLEGKPVNKSHRKLTKYVKESVYLLLVANSLY
jgi:alkane 1-monooxygenase